jgi:hypothetical protein
MGFTDDIKVAASRLHYKFYILGSAIRIIIFAGMALQCIMFILTSKSKRFPFPSPSSLTLHSLFQLVLQLLDCWHYFFFRFDHTSQFHQVVLVLRPSSTQSHEMILCVWDAPEGHPGQCCIHLYARILYQHLSPQFQFSLSGVTLVYLSQ